MDPADPRCPDCDGPVAATSVYCMHCGADIAGVTAETPPADGADDSADVSDADDVSWARTSASGAVPSATSTTSDEGRDGGRLDDLLAPDGLLDDSLTVVVAIAAGVVLGVLAFLFSAIMTGHWVSLVVGLAAWLGGTVWLGRQRTVLGAVRLACYAVALVLVLGPVAAFSPVVGVSNDSLGSRLVVFLVGEAIVFVPVLGLVLAGFLAGRRRPGADST